MLSRWQGGGLFAMAAARFGAGAVGLVLLLGLAGCHGPDRAGPTPLLSPAEATAATRQLWADREAALQSRNAPGIRKHDEGVAAAIDLANWSPKPGSQVLLSRRSVDRIEVAVPRQVTWPVRFLAAVTSDSVETDPELTLLLLSRRDQRSPWRLAWSADLAANTGYPAFALDDDGYTLPAPPDAELAMATGRASAALAGYLTRLTADKKLTAAAGEFTPGKFTYGHVAADRAEISTARENGDRASTRWRASEAPAFGVRLADGGALVVGAVEREHTKTYKWLGGLYQDDGRTRLDPRLAPGAYAGLTTISLHAVAIHVPPAGPGRRPAVLAETSGKVNVKGRRQ